MPPRDSRNFQPLMRAIRHWPNCRCACSDSLTSVTAPSLSTVSVTSIFLMSRDLDAERALLRAHVAALGALALLRGHVLDLRRRRASSAFVLGGLGASIGRRVQSRSVALLMIFFDVAASRCVARRARMN